MIYILVKKMFTQFNLMDKGTRLRSNGLNDMYCLFLSLHCMGYINFFYNIYHLRARAFHRQQLVNAL